MLATSPKNRRLNKDQYDDLSIPNYVIKKGPSHGARHGPTERQRILARSPQYNQKGNLKRSQDSQTKIGGMNTLVQDMTRAHQRTILTLRQGGNEAETKTRGSSH